MVDLADQKKYHQHVDQRGSRRHAPESEEEAPVRPATAADDHPRKVREEPPSAKDPHQDVLKGVAALVVSGHGQERQKEAEGGEQKPGHTVHLEESVDPADLDPKWNGHQVNLVVLFDLVLRLPGECNRYHLHQERETVASDHHCSADDLCQQADGAPTRLPAPEALLCIGKGEHFFRGNIY